MRREQAILPAIFIVFGGFLFSWQVSAKVLISKVQIAGVSTTDEYIELYNFASSSANITNWSLTKETAGGSASKLVSGFPDNSQIAPYSYLLIGHHDYLPINNTFLDYFYTNSSYSLASNNRLILTNSSDEIQDDLSWGAVSSTTGSPAQNPGSLKSLVRLPNNNQGNYHDSDNSLVDFVEIDSVPFNSTSPARPLYELPIIDATSTPETTPPTSTENITSTIFINWSALHLNEVMPNPTEGDEWVEIYNSTSSEIDLSGATLCDNRSADSCTILNLSGTIAALSWKIFFLSGSKLNNDGDSVILKNNNAEIIDQAIYGGIVLPAKGNSLARIQDGIGEWKITLTPTPSTTNIITSPPPPIIPTPAVSSGGSSPTVAPTPIPKKIATSTVTTDKYPIIFNLEYPKNIFIASSTTFDAQLSADPRGGEIMYSWTWGDGGVSEGSIVNHTYATTGVFSISIHATSSQGSVGTKSFSIRVNNVNTNKERVFISGIFPRPDSETEEWVSIESASTNTIDLSGWKIGTDSEKWYTLPLKTVLKPFGTLRFYKTVTKLALNNAGGSVLLADPLGEIIDFLNFSKGKIGDIFLNPLKTGASSTSVTSATSTPPAVLGVKITKPASSVNYYSGITLADARELPLKSKTTLIGTVVSLPNHPYVNYFYISDESGGIQIYSYKKLFPTLSLGEKIKVYGEISSLQGRPRLRISSANMITKISSSTSTEPETKNIIDVDENDFGRLLTLEGEITDLNTTSFFLDDTSAEVKVNLPQKTNVNKKDLVRGARVKVTGIVEQSAEGWNITPRTALDVKLLSTVDYTSTSSTSSTTNIAVGAGGGLFLVGLAAIIKKWITKK